MQQLSRLRRCASVTLPSPHDLATFRQSPQETYGSLDLPTLMIGGLLDPVAPPESHVANIVTILCGSSQAPITARLLPGVNHLMQDAKSGLPTEYASLDNSISPDVLEIIKDWIQQQRGSSRSPTNITGGR